MHSLITIYTGNHPVKIEGISNGTAINIENDSILALNLVRCMTTDTKNDNGQNKGWKYRDFNSHKQ
jgi:hypothetical protein